MQFANAVKFFPFVNTIRNYSFTKFKADVTAAFTVALVSLPQSMAYVVIAGVNPKYGIYAIIVPAIVFSLFGSSRYLIAGPTNAVSMVAASTLSSIMIGGMVADKLPEDQKVQVLFLMAFIAGIIQLILGLARFGNLTNFVSHSVIVGFMAGAGLLIAFNQLKNFLGLGIPSYSHFFDAFFATFNNLSQVNFYSLAIGMATVCGIIIFRKIIPRVPGSFLTMLISAIAVFAFNLEAKGVALVGEIPRSLPPISTFPLDFELVRTIFMPALAVAILAIVEAFSTSKSIALVSGERINGSQQFIGQGLSNIAAAFFSSIPISGSPTRSTLNYESGARSRFAGVYAGLIVLLFAVTLAPLAKYIPISSLAGVLMVTAYGMINKKGILLSLKATRADRLVLIVTFLSTIFLELDKAIYVGVILSIILYLRYVSRPPVVKMVPRVPDGKLVPYKEGLPDCSEVAIYQIEGSLFFGAIEELEERLALIDYRSVQVIVLRLKQVRLIDATAIHALNKFLRECEQKNIKVIFAGVRASVLRVFTRSKLIDQIGSENIVEDTNAAVKLAYAKYVSQERCLNCKHHVFAECREAVLSS